MIYLDLFLTFFKIGAFTFGGGYAMIALIQSEVLSKGWAAQTEVINYVALSESTPGPLAINAATFVGTKVGGVPGAVVATLGVVLPSFIVILIVAKVFTKFKESFVIKGMMSGIKPAVVGLIGTAIFTSVVAILNNILGGESFTLSPALICSVVIFLIAGGMELKKVHPIAIIVVSAVLGIVSGYAGFI